MNFFGSVPNEISAPFQSCQSFIPTSTGAPGKGSAICKKSKTTNPPTHHIALWSCLQSHRFQASLKMERKFNLVSEMFLGFALKLRIRSLDVYSYVFIMTCMCFVTPSNTKKERKTVVA